MEFIKFIHVMAGVSFFGLVIAGFFYINHSYLQNNPALVKYAFKASFFSDLFILPVIIVLFATAHFLITGNHLSLATPWIKMAYIALSALSVGWLANLGIKWHNYRQANIKHSRFLFHRTFYMLNIILFLVFMVIIHDAVMQRTFTWFH